MGVSAAALGRCGALLSLLVASPTLAFTCDTDKTVVWPADGVLDPSGYLLVEGEGTWRREVEHFPISRLTFVGEKTTVRAIATLLSEPGALRAQVTIRASSPLLVGEKYRLRVEANSSCVEKPRSDFLRTPRSIKGPVPLEWTVQAPISGRTDALKLNAARATTCAKPPCLWKRLELGVEAVPATGEFAVLLTVKDANETKKVIAVISEGRELGVTENGCNKGVFYDSHGKICVAGRLILRSGELGPESAQQCFSTE